MELEENPLYRKSHTEVMGLLGARPEEPMDGMNGALGSFNPPNVVPTPVQFDARNGIGGIEGCVLPIRD